LNEGKGTKKSAVDHWDEGRVRKKQQSEVQRRGGFNAVAIDVQRIGGGEKRWHVPGVPFFRL